MLLHKALLLMYAMGKYSLLLILVLILDTACHCRHIAGSGKTGYNKTNLISGCLIPNFNIKVITLFVLLELQK